MNRLSCCGRGSRRSGVAGMVFSGAALVFMPKCPVCVAGWVMFLTGIGITHSAAERVRIASLIIGIGCLVWFTLRVVRWGPKSVGKPRP